MRPLVDKYPQVDSGWVRAIFLFSAAAGLKPESGKATMAQV